MLAGEGGAHEARRLVRREAEEDLLQNLLQESRRRLVGGFFRYQRRHGSWLGGGEGSSVSGGEKFCVLRQRVAVLEYSSTLLGKKF